jgi:hypothetical protein
MHTIFREGLQNLLFQNVPPMKSMSYAIDFFKIEGFADPP